METNCYGYLQPFTVPQSSFYTGLPGPKPPEIRRNKKVKEGLKQNKIQQKSTKILKLIEYYRA